MSYVPLYIKTNNSLLTSMIKIDELIIKAKQYNINALTITDDNMYGVMDFYKKCLKNSIKPIIGLNIKIDDLDIILYALNNDGYKNLLKIQTINSSNSLDIEILKKYSDNLIGIIPYTSLKLYDIVNKIFAKVFIGYKNNSERNKLKGNNLIYLNEILYLDKDDEKYIRYLMAIKDGITVKNVIFDKKDNYFLSLDEVKEKYPLDLENNNYIYDNCNVKLEFKLDLLPIYDCPDNMDSYSYLKKLCVDGLKKIFGNTIYEAYKDRLKYELSIINKMGFCNYFLVVYDYVKYAKEHNILVGPGRGSAAGSLVAYLLGITIVDPIKHNLLFERFLNPERITMPDIDIDFEDTKREEVIKYCVNKYGDKKVAPIITFGTMASKQAIRDVGRAMDVSLNVIDSICKKINSNLSLKENYESNKRLQEIINMNNINKKIFNIALKFEGIKRHTSVHAAGIVMSRVDLDEVIPLDKQDDLYITGYDMNYLEEIGLLKMDFLALKNLTLIKDCLNDIPDHISFYDIPINDDKAISVFTNVDTEGIFQFETNGMKNFLKKFKPTSFEDISVALALFRPGPMQNIDLFINRKYGKEKIEYFHEDLVSILKPTYGIIVYQEQIMQIASVLAGYSYGEADIFRKAMKDKKEEVLLNEKDKFISRSIDKGYSKELALKVYDLILKFASYGFNKAHSVSYAYISTKMAYLKVHYPLYFLRQLLNGSIGISDKTKEYIYECKKYNINVLRPDINTSTHEYKNYNNSLLVPLTIIKNLGDFTTKKIMEERNNKDFKDIFDFVVRTYGNGLNKQILENLIYAGALDSFGINKHTLIENIDLIINYSEIGELIDDDSLKPQLVMYDEYSKNELFALEKEVFGFYLSSNPIIEFKRKYPNTIDLNNIENFFDKNIEVIVSIETIKEIMTKNGDKMVFLNCVDELTKKEIVLFPKVYEKYNDLKKGSIYLIKGLVQKRYDQYQISASTLEELKMED